MNFSVDSAFLNALASSAPTPGGGSAAAYAGAMAAALVTMVAQTTIGKKKYADVQERMQQIVEAADAHRLELEFCVYRDATAFDSLLSAYRVSKETANPEQIERSTFFVTEVPLGTAKIALHVLELAVELAAAGNSNAVSDACAAASLASSAIFASALNVKVNAKSLEAHPLMRHYIEEVDTVEARTQQLMAQLPQIIQERMGIG